MVASYRIRGAAQAADGPRASGCKRRIQLAFRLLPLSVLTVMRLVAGVPRT
jgi:hypothetical protein